MQCSRAWEGERDAPILKAARQVPEHISAGRALLREKFSSSNENPHGFELRRTLSCKAGLVGFVSFLTPNRNAQRPNIATAVE